MPSYRAPRGTRDLLPSETPAWTRLERLAADLATRYGYRRIETPLFEQAEVFERGIGEVTDVVEKELFRLAPRLGGFTVAGWEAAAHDAAVGLSVRAMIFPPEKALNIRIACDTVPRTRSPCCRLGKRSERWFVTVILPFL